MKPHGSVDWGRKVMRLPPYDPPEREWVIQNATALDSGDIEVRGDWNSGHSNIAWVPALTVPIESKLIFECPPAHMKALELELPRVDRVLTIGWRATEVPFLNFLQEHMRGGIVAALFACHSAEDERGAIERVLRGRAIHGPFEGAQGRDFSALPGTDILEQELLRN